MEQSTKIDPSELIRQSLFSAMNTKEDENDFEQHLNVDFDYRGMKITVYRNGEEYYDGLSVVISRRQFRHWIKFLDYLSTRLGMGAAVHRIYTLDGFEIHKFDELEANGSYVAVTHGPFIQLNYETKKGDDKEKLKRWNYDPKIEKKECGSLDSAESVEIYLKRCGYATVTGLPFPFDAPRPGSPVADNKRTSKSKSPEPRLCQRLLPAQNSLTKNKSLRLKPSEQASPSNGLEHSVSMNKVDDVAGTKNPKCPKPLSIKSDDTTGSSTPNPDLAFPSQITSTVIPAKNLPEKKSASKEETANSLKLPKLDNGTIQRQLEVKARIPESILIKDMNSVAPAPNDNIENDKATVVKINATDDNVAEKMNDTKKQLNVDEKINGNNECPPTISSIDNSGITIRIDSSLNEATEESNKIPVIANLTKDSSAEDGATVPENSKDGADNKDAKENISSKSLFIRKDEAVPKSPVAAISLKDSSSNPEKPAKLNINNTMSHEINNGSSNADVDISQNIASVTPTVELNGKKQPERKENVGNSDNTNSKENGNFSKSILPDQPAIASAQRVNIEKSQELSGKEFKSGIPVNEKCTDSTRDNGRPIGKLKYKADQVYIPLLIKSMKIGSKPAPKDSPKVQAYNSNCTRDNSISQVKDGRYAKQLANDQQITDTTRLDLIDSKRAVTINADMEKPKESASIDTYDNDYLENQRPIPMCYDPDFGDFDFI